MREQGCIVPYATRRQALNQVARYLSQFKKYPRGICRFCGCTEYNACTSQFNGVMTACSWADESETVCTAPFCSVSFGDWKVAQQAAAEIIKMQ